MATKTNGELRQIPPDQMQREAEDLTDEQVETLVKVFAIRHKRGDFAGHKETFEARAEEQLTKKYEALLQDLLPEPPAGNGKKSAAKKKKAGAT